MHEFIYEFIYAFIYEFTHVNSHVMVVKLCKAAISHQQFMKSSSRVTLPTAATSDMISGESPACTQKILSSMVAASGSALNTSQKVFHILTSILVMSTNNKSNSISAFLKEILTI